MNIHYILSESFDYSRMICDDAGPEYAKRQGWVTVPLSAAHTVANEPHVFDNRLTTDELPLLEKHVAAFPTQPIFLKVVDPYFEKVSQPFYQTLLALVSKINVELVGPYRETGITALAGRIAGRSLYHCLPYAYDPSREQPLDSTTRTRRRQLLFSGALGQVVYPDRWRFYKAQRRSLWGWRLVKHLKHPGYPDVGMKQSHSIIADHFIAFASSYAAMWVDPTVEGLELLKYCECAYAGCVPFGLPAPTLPTAASAEVWPVPAGAEAQAVRCGLGRGSSELFASALRYRDALRAHRNPNSWNVNFIEWWQIAAARLRRSDVSIGSIRVS